jgi:replicative DNA helicase
VRLTACGRQAWERFTRCLADEQNRPDFEDCLRGPWGKLRGYCARLALIVHYLRLATGEVDGENVDGESVSRAARLVGYFQGHARRVYARIDADPRVAGALKVARWIEANGLRYFTKRDAYQALKGTYKRAEELDPLLALLESHGYIRCEPPPARVGRGRGPSPVYAVNPALVDEELEMSRK